MCFHRVPNEIVMKILRKLTLQKRVCLRAVSSRWLALIESLCLEITSLKLIGSLDNVRDYCISLTHEVHPSDLTYWKLKPIGSDDDLVVIRKDRFSHKSIDFLTGRFTNVKHLFIHFHDEPLWLQVSTLLAQFT